MPSDQTPELRRVLGTRDLVLFNIAAVVGIRWLAAAAHTGPGSIFLWAAAAVCFFIPSGIVVASLTRQFAEEGGIYIWTSKAFGPWHGFFCAMSYWTGNLFYFPSLVIAGAGMALTIFGAQYAALADNRGYMIAVSLTLIWVITAANIGGLDIGKWIGNLGGFATYSVGLALVIAGAIAYWQSGPATRLDFAPHLDWEKVNFWPQIAFAFGGLELAAILGGEVRDPVRSIRRSIWISGAAITAFYIAGTLAMLVLVPSQEVSVVTGLTQAGTVAGTRFSLPWFSPLLAVLITVGVAGQLGAWITGTARLPMMLGVDRHLPAFFAELHPRFATPYKALLLQAAACSVFLVAMHLGENLRAGYQLLVDMMVITYFIPFLYLFAAAWKFGLRVSAVSGGAVTSIALAFSLVPPAGVSSTWLFELKLVGGTLLLTLLARLWYVRRMRAAQ